MKKTNRFIALLTALVLVFSTMITSVAFAAVNTDVVGTDYEVAVGKLKAVGIMEGYPDGTFLPAGEITRAEFAKIAVVAMGLGDAAEASKGTTKFADVPATNWAAGYINLAANRGLITGYPDGTYRPDGKLTNAEAITILCRLVGLGPVIDKEGTWPANYVGRAANEGILDDVNVASGTKATRGNVAVMLVNTLTIQEWGATGYGDDGSVDYGRLGTSLLVDKLNVTEDDVLVTDYNTDDNELTLDFDLGGAGTFEVATNVDVDLYDAFLNEATVWINEDDEVIYVDVTSDYFIDAIEINDDNDEVTLVGADKTYDLDLDTTNVNGAADAFVGGETYPLAKVVLNDKNDVVAIDAYELTEVIVVDSVKEDVVTDVAGDETDLEDYTIFKDGKLIAATAMVKGDILAINAGEEFADVYTKSVTGPITEIFSNTVEVKNVEYDFDASQIQNIMYLNEDGDYVAFDTDAAEQMQDEGDVVVFTDRAGDAVYITGKLGAGDTSTVAGVLADNAAFDESFGKAYGEFVFINEEGKKVTKNIKFDNLEKIDGVDVEDDTFTLAAPNVTGSGGTNVTAAATTEGTLVEFVYDADGAVVELNFLSTDAFVTLETDDKYVADMQLQPETLVFVVDDLAGANGIDADEVTVTQWSKITAFDTIDAGTVYSNDDNEALYIVADATDVNTEDTTTVTGLLDSFLTNTDGEITRLTAWVNGAKKTYTVDKLDNFGYLGTDGIAEGGIGDAIGEDGTLIVGNVYDLEINDASGKVTAIPVADEVDATSVNAVIENIDILTVDTGARTFDLEAAVAPDLKLVSGAVILNAVDLDDVTVKAVRDLKTLTENTNEVVLVYDEAGTNFVKMVIIITE